MASPEFQEIYDTLVQNGIEAAEAGVPPTIEGINELMETLFSYDMPPGAEARVIEANGVPSEWVCAEGVDPARRILFFHGGGYVAGTLDGYRGFAAYLSQACDAAVLNVDYRMGPDHFFPAAVDDALSSWNFIVANGPHGPGKAAATFVIGDSAGGGLALALLLKLKMNGADQPNAAVPLSPWTDLTTSGSSYDTQAEVDPMVGRELLQWMASMYVTEADVKDPLASPLFGDLAGLPPLQIMVGERETMQDDSNAFTERARAAGVDVTLEVAPEMIHIWPVFGPSVPEAVDAIGRIGAFVKAHA